MKILLSNWLLAVMAFCGSILAIVFGTVDVFNNPQREVFDRWRWLSGAYLMTMITFMIAYASRYLDLKDGLSQTTKEHIAGISACVAVMYGIFVVPFAPTYDVYKDIKVLDVLPAILGLSALHGAIFYLITNKEAQIRVSVREYAGVLAVAVFFVVISRLMIRVFV